jgi:hypothetical protein
MPDERPKILVAVPNLGNIRTGLSILFPHWLNNVKYHVELFPPEDLIPLDYARNIIRKQFLANDYDFLLTVDADVVPPVDVLDLASIDKDVVAPVCYVLKEEGIIPMALKRVKEGWQVIGDLDRNKLYDVDCAGIGCLMIARRVLEKVPLFRFVYDSDGMLVTDEGFNWSDRVKEAGFNIYVFSNMVCDHFRTINLKQLVDIQNRVRQNKVTLSKEA